MAKTLKELEKELAKLEKDFGKGKFEIDEEARVVKKKGAKTMKGSEVASVGQSIWEDRKKASEDKG